ncbi:hypothetical protein EGW08_022551 [Elysia chlorotica]|uniref:Uncharacterized protein n=1 Tax=Elysia chlorotica TaxID=188477 RepID=A0A3S1AR29_ELYCH|nr:hypothetical protein EGW08_022551 [Elysia chlorotica]
MNMATILKNCSTDIVAAEQMRRMHHRMLTRSEYGLCTKLSLDGPPSLSLQGESLCVEKAEQQQPMYSLRPNSLLRFPPGLPFQSREYARIELHKPARQSRSSSIQRMHGGFDEYDDDGKTTAMKTNRRSKWSKVQDKATDGAEWNAFLSGCYNETSESGAYLRVYEQRPHVYLKSDLVVTHLPWIYYKATGLACLQENAPSLSELPCEGRVMSRLQKTMANLGIKRPTRSAPPQRLPILTAQEKRDVYKCSHPVFKATSDCLDITAEPVVARNRRGKVLTLGMASICTLNFSAEHAADKRASGPFSHSLWTSKVLSSSNGCRKTNKTDIPFMSGDEYISSLFGTRGPCVKVLSSKDSKDNANKGNTHKEAISVAANAIEDRHKQYCNSSDAQDLNTLSDHPELANPHNEEPPEKNFPEPTTNQSQEEKMIRFLKPLEKKAEMCVDLDKHESDREKIIQPDVQPAVYETADTNPSARTKATVESEASAPPSGLKTTSVLVNPLPQTSETSNIQHDVNAGIKDHGSITLENKSSTPASKVADGDKDIYTQTKGDNIGGTGTHARLPGESAQGFNARSPNYPRDNPLGHGLIVNESVVSALKESKAAITNPVIKEQTTTSISSLSTTYILSVAPDQQNKNFPSVISDNKLEGKRDEKCTTSTKSHANSLCVSKPTKLVCDAGENLANRHPAVEERKDRLQAEKYESSKHQNGESIPVMIDRKTNHLVDEKKGENNDNSNTAGKASCPFVENGLNWLTRTSENASSESPPCTFNKTTTHANDGSIPSVHKDAPHRLENCLTVQNAGLSIKGIYKQNIADAKKLDVKISAPGKNGFPDKRNYVQRNKEKISEYGPKEKRVSVQNSCASNPGKTFNSTKTSQKTPNRFNDHSKRIRNCTERLCSKKPALMKGEVSSQDSSKPANSPKVGSDVSSIIKIGDEEFEEVDDYQWVVKEVDEGDMKDGVIIYERRLIKRLVPRKVLVQKQPKAAKPVRYRKPPAVASLLPKRYKDRRGPSAAENMARRLSVPCQPININFQAEVSVTQAWLEELKLMPPRRKGKAAISSPNTICAAVAQLKPRSNTGDSSGDLGFRELVQELALTSTCFGEKEPCANSTFYVGPLKERPPAPASEPSTHSIVACSNYVSDFQEDAAEKDSKVYTSGGTGVVLEGHSSKCIEIRSPLPVEHIPHTRTSNSSEPQCEAQCLAQAGDFSNRETHSEVHYNAQDTVGPQCAQDSVAALLGEWGRKTAAPSPCDEGRNHDCPTTRSEYSSVTEEDMPTEPMLAAAFWNEAANSFYGRVRRAAASISHPQLATTG